MKGLNIRAAELRDAEALRSVHLASIRTLCSTHYSPEQIERWTNKPLEGYLRAIRDAKVVVAELQGVTVGFGQVDLQSGVIHAIYVHPDYVRRGIGTRLLRSLEADADRAGLQRLTLNSTLNAVGFYRANKYTERGPATNPLPDGTSLPCTRMEKALVSELETPVDQAIAPRVLAPAREAS